MPQGKKTPPEKIRFKRMLQNINLLYLGSSVLILQELSYMSRFWRAPPPLFPAAQLNILRTRP